MHIIYIYVYTYTYIIPPSLIQRYVTVLLVLKIANKNGGGVSIKTYLFAVVAAYTT